MAFLAFQFICMLQDSAAAYRAVQSLHNMDLGGRAIKVGRLNNMGEVVRFLFREFIFFVEHQRAGYTSILKE